MRKALKFILFSALLVTVVGCSRDKGDKRANVSNRYNRSQNPSDYMNNPYNRNMGGVQGEWGQIYSNSGSFSQALRAFMAGVNDLGYVSGQMHDPETGIWFRGQVDVCRVSGQIDILVWDSNAYNYGEPRPYFWSAMVESVSDSGSRVVITARDSAGRITLDGTANQNGNYSGTVRFQNDDGQAGTLGQFQIYTNALLSCN